MNYPTWSDLNNASIVPPLGERQVPDLGPVAVLVSTEPDIRYLRTLSETSDSRSFFMGTLMTRTADGISFAGPYIGAPYAVMLLESLIARGARTIIVLGWCGAVSPDLVTGDLVIPSHAIVDEGTSCNYQVLDPDLPCTTPDKNLSEHLCDHVTGMGVQVRRHPIWTTDAIYRETRQKVAWFRDHGACAVEMECSALFAVAQFRGVSLTALLVVSDSVASKSGDWEPGFRKKTFKAARKSACNAVMGFAGKIMEHEI